MKPPKPNFKKFRITPFQIRTLIALIVGPLLLKYLNSIESIRYQDLMVMIPISAFLLIVKPSPYYGLTKRFKSPESIAVFLYIVLVVPGLLLLNVVYQDWDNRRMVHMLSKDFPSLVANIENSAGVELKIKTGCFKTQEKFSEGKKNCSISAWLGSEESKNIDKYFKQLDDSGLFDKIVRENERAAESQPNKYATCNFAKDRISIECIYVAKRNNSQLAKKILNEDTLNARKDQILQELRNQ